jgi:catechol 2,3-dioxygenase-like lactoylglutathione lyase family enzyme
LEDEVPADQRIGSMMIHHVGYVVDDIHEAIAQWENVFGAGPFTVLDQVQFDELAVDGQTATVDHSAAFGPCGTQLVELQTYRDIRPERLRERLLGPRRPGIHHVAIAAPDLERESDRLADLGFPVVVRARSGPFQIFWHDTQDALGFLVEVHRSGPDFDAFFAAVRSGGADR